MAGFQTATSTWRHILLSTTARSSSVRGALLAPFGLEIELYFSSTGRLFDGVGWAWAHLRERAQEQFLQLFPGPGLPAQEGQAGAHARIVGEAADPDDLPQ